MAGILLLGEMARKFGRELLVLADIDRDDAIRQAPSPRARSKSCGRSACPRYRDRSFRNAPHMQVDATSRFHGPLQRRDRVIVAAARQQRRAGDEQGFARLRQVRDQRAPAARPVRKRCSRFAAVLRESHREGPARSASGRSRRALRDSRADSGARAPRKPHRSAQTSAVPSRTALQRRDMAAGLDRAAKEAARLGKWREDQLERQHAGHRIRACSRRRSRPRDRRARGLLAREDEAAVIGTLAAIGIVVRRGDKLKPSGEFMREGIAAGLAEEEIVAAPQCCIVDSARERTIQARYGGRFPATRHRWRRGFPASHTWEAKRSRLKRGP